MTSFIKTASDRWISKAATSLFALSLACGAAAAQDVAIIQPGAPGEPAKELSAEEASAIADTSYSSDDVKFMQDMIPHHAQAVEMSALVSERTNSESLVDIAGRIDASQADEIQFMENWLADRGEDLPSAHAHHGTHMSHEMMGMATPEQMADLAASEGVAFDELFLTLMIRHHEGALTMVEDLLAQPGSAYDPVLFEFITDIQNDQSAEIERMNDMLAGLSGDPRAALSAGFRDAGEAVSNLTKIVSLPKPPGFFDPQNPAGIPPVIEADESEDGDEDMSAHDGHHDHADHGDMEMTESEDSTEREDDQSNEETEWGERSPLLSFSNTDMAFAGDMLIVGNYHGFNIYTLVEDAAPQLISSVVCPGGQGDVSIVENLLIMSVEQTRGRVDCGLQGVSEDISEDRFRGLRIFDISDPKLPTQVGIVQTCRGSHTHSVVSGPDENGKIVVYNSGTASIREGEELEGCVGEVPGDDRTALFRIDVIEIPVDDPSKARIVDSPAVFADADSGQIAGLWQGGDHGEDTQDSSRTDHCHDITVFPEQNIAAGACSGNGVIFDISDPYNPTRIDAVLDQKFAYWHSATFNNDGTKVLFTDEWGGGSRPRCRPSDPMDWGANAIYDIVDGKLEFRSYFKLPAPQTEQENCVAHNGSVVPVPGRDIFVQAWYQGGMSVIDFTDSANPEEIAYFDRGPIHEERLILGGYWSTYWYDGKIYGTEIVRGLDVFELNASGLISENELAAAAVADQGELFNPQQQFKVTWPEGDPSVALAFVDQLVRSNDMATNDAAEYAETVSAAAQALAANEKNRRVSNKLRSLASDLKPSDADSIAEMRMAELETTLRDLAKRIR
jgi:uncharacterized protein (DUF305 family)/polyhydroxyalkanoate synthesis regulator phasin